MARIMTIKIRKEDIPKHRNEELHNELVRAGHHVIPNKKKQQNKYAARIKAYEIKGEFR